ncbi:hypothetical protein NLJ89_g5250 [Agrocybe chaxingu]|uniref:Diphthamide biosynthesis protein 4 n=1 Tax=Agrocybe chaxingu TaxID=84603 RepID=A0A9W8K1L1_9AGAR|nr:hypothetical protein NLJ89_g5250 [Agrocybe chaxingu]
MAPSQRTVNFYDLLSVSMDAPIADIKQAYHRILLQSHPDKRGDACQSADGVDISLIKEAYTVLSSEDLRRAYDANRRDSPGTTGPRPAQVVSLEEFEEETRGNVEESEEGPWRYPCRCGGCYRITVALMDEGEHLIACNSCSEVIWAGYEVAEP